MGTLGPNNGATFVSDGTVRAVAITNPTNSQLSDDSYATSVFLLGQITNYLKATNFGFTIPLDATITGIAVDVERSGTLTNGITDSSAKIVKGGTISGDEQLAAVIWSTSDEYATFGSSTSLWGTTWTPVDINSTGFGFVLSSVAALAATANIDHIRITVYYTGSNRPSNLFSAVKVGNGMSRNDLAT